MKAHRLAKAFLVVAVVAMASVTGAWWVSREMLPIMKCDPVDLKAGMTRAEVVTLCGEPRSTTEKGRDWYPILSGEPHDTRTNKKSQKDVTLHYGSIWNDDHNVNLYLRGDRLESVQVYGDYK